jgi:hypothetical protein
VLAEMTGRKSGVKHVKKKARMSIEGAIGFLTVKGIG